MSKKFHTPGDLAEVYLSQGIGTNLDHPYWKGAKKDELIVGHLQLILEEQRGVGRRSVNKQLRLHTEFLNSCYFTSVERVIAWRKRTLRRIEKLVPNWDDRAMSPSRLAIRRMCSVDYRAMSIGHASECYRDEGWQVLHEILEESRKKMAVVDSIKTVDDLAGVPGVGKKTIERIKAYVENIE